jgi:hypothetical protein
VFDALLESGAGRVFAVLFRLSRVRWSGSGLEPSPSGTKVTVRVRWSGSGLEPSPSGTKVTVTKDQV